MKFGTNELLLGSGANGVINDANSSVFILLSNFGRDLKFMERV